MRITADTNLLVRAAVLDHPQQAKLAAALLRDAELIAVTLPALCEFVWVLGRGYGRSRGEIVGYIKNLADSPTVRLDRSAVEAAIAVMEAGGDFADGVIAFEGRRLGGTVFASFDRGAVELISKLGGDASLVG